MDIFVDRVSKTYKVHKKNPGLRESIKSLFHREYHIIEAVKNISLSFRTGEIIGFIGPNGSGKTTTMKMIAGLLHPTSDQIIVGPYTPSERKKEFLKNIGFVIRPDCESSPCCI